MREMVEHHSEIVHTLSKATYVMEERLLRRNLRLIRYVAERSGVEILVAFKAFAQWSLFPIFQEEGFSAASVSSINEARLAYEELGSKGHAFSPAYMANDFPTWQQLTSHLVFNSLSQANRFLLLPNPQGVKYGLRINPGYSPVETALYNPAMPGSRFGVTAQDLKGGLPKGIEGLHFHLLCEGTSFQLERVLAHVTEQFDAELRQVSYINMGGGHLITEASYNIDHLVEVLLGFRQRYPHLKVYLEPGSAFAWQTGFLLAHVVDIVEHEGITTAILDVSFTCHMPDCLEMPYQPRIRGAESLPLEAAQSDKNAVRLGGCSCLSGDFLGSWRFEKPLAIGDPIIFEDMLHYTLVKTTMFNGIDHPDIALLQESGHCEVLRSFSYQDYKERMN